MPGRLRSLGIGVSVGAAVSVLLGAGRRVALPRRWAPLPLEAGPGERTPLVVEVVAGIVELEADPAPEVAPAAVLPRPPVIAPVGGNASFVVRSGVDRRSAQDRRLADVDGLVGRIIRASDRRHGGDRRRGLERRMAEVEGGRQQPAAA